MTIEEKIAEFVDRFGFNDEDEAVFHVFAREILELAEEKCEAEAARHDRWGNRDFACGASGCAQRIRALLPPAEGKS